MSGRRIKNFDDQIQVIFLSFTSALLQMHMENIHNVMSNISLGSDVQYHRAQREEKALFQKQMELLVYIEATETVDKGLDYISLKMLLPASCRSQIAGKFSLLSYLATVCACDYFLYCLRVFHWKAF